jgi:hypothetical protein
LGRAASTRSFAGDFAASASWAAPQVGNGVSGSRVCQIHLRSASGLQGRFGMDLNLVGFAIEINPMVSH